MNFFGIQEKAKRESLLLLIAFCVAIAFNALIINLFASWLTSGLANSFSAFALSIINWSITAAIWVLVLKSCRERWRDVRKGGHLLAATYGAMFVSEHAADTQDRDLLNIIAEMAIASSQQEPACFCLRDETNINAFLVGTKDDVVLVVTQGAIEKLERAELKAMIAHEYGHISNNDLTINMRLLIVLGGLNVINNSGRAMCEEAASLARRIRKNQKLDNNEHMIGAALQLVFGVFFRILGCTLVFSGDIIKAAFSRKREYLADAKSVQYTRNSWSMASALHKASTKSTQAALHGRYASELDHLCFFGPWKHQLFSGLLASHPSPQSRIELIDPLFALKQRQKARSSHESVAASVTKSASSFEPVIILNDTAIGTSYVPIQQLSEQISILLSVAVAASGNDETTMRKHHQQLLNIYTADKHPMRATNDPKFEQDLVQALDALLLQPAAQRQALLRHIQEIVEQDNIVMPEEKKMYQQICQRLNPPANAA